MQNGSLKRTRRQRGPDVWAYRWRERGPDGKVVYRNRVLGTIEEIPTRTVAFSATAALRRETNPDEVRACNHELTVSELVAHYRLLELRPENAWKTYSTKRGYEGYLKRWIMPRWGAYRLYDIKSGEVEAWLKQLTLARSTCSKIRNVMSVLFNHARRHDLFDRNPIQWVRQSAKRRRAPEVLTAQEIQSLLPALALRERTLVLLDVGTGLRMSELFALRWKDVDIKDLQIHVSRSVVYQVVGICKTEASQKLVPLHRTLANALAEWRRATPYPNDDDWVFASPRTQGRKPYWGQALSGAAFNQYCGASGSRNRSAGTRFRHTYSTLLKAVGTDIKVMQELLRHASVRVTLDTYTQALTASKREAQASVLKLLDLVCEIDEPERDAWSKKLASLLKDFSKWLHLDLFRPRFFHGRRA